MPADATASVIRTNAGRSSAKPRGMHVLYDASAILDAGMRLRIRTKLAILVLAALLPLLVAATLRFWSDVAEGRRQADQVQLDTARFVAGQLDEVLSGQ